MKNTLLVLLSLLIIVPFHVFSDGVGGPYCDEPKDWNGYGSDPNGIRGTCKDVEIKNVLSLDRDIQHDYLLGAHAAIGYNCDGKIGCESGTTYSEYFTMTSSSTLEFLSLEADSAPLQIAVFDKSFFLSLLTNQFAQNHLSFSEKNFSDILFNVYEPNEFSKIQKEDPYTVPPDIQLDSLLVNKNYLSDISDSLKTSLHTLEEFDRWHKQLYPYVFNTLSYKEYGKHVYAPKGDLIESQYADLYKNDNAITNQDLGISSAGEGSGLHTVVAITSPLESITHYWIYSKHAGKLTLTWQKTEYLLDDGSIKTITPQNKAGAGFVFGKNTASTIVPEQSSAGNGFESTSSVELAKSNGLFKEIWNWIISWFR